MKPILAPHLDPANVLDNAADYITAYGWCQGDYSSTDALRLGQEHPRVCALGAIYRFTRGGWAIEILTDYLADLGYFPSIIAWNDGPDRTADEVAATMHSAAEAWRATQSGGAA